MVLSRFHPQSSKVILQVLPALHSGGVERGTIEMARAIIKAGLQAVVVSSGGAMVKELYEVGARHIVLPLDSKNPITMYQNIALLETVIKENNVGLVHARSRAPAWSAYVAAKHCNIPFITTFHGTYGLSNMFKRKYNSIMVKGERVIAVSSFIKNHILEHYSCDESKVQVIHRGADLDLFNPEAIPVQRRNNLTTALKLTPNLPLILLPGRLTRWKGQEVCIEAVKILKAQAVQPFQCIFAGEAQGHGRYEAELLQHIHQAGLDDTIRLVGKVSDMATCYALSDIVLSTSTRPEAFGRVAVEAQAMGKLVIATGIGGSQETVIPGQTGWLVAPEDPQALASAIAEALRLPDSQKQVMSQAAIRHVRENFSTEVMCCQTLKLYDELLHFTKGEVFKSGIAA